MLNRKYFLLVLFWGCFALIMVKLLKTFKKWKLILINLVTLIDTTLFNIFKINFKKGDKKIIME